MDEPEKIPIAGRVVWITPTGAQGNRQAGVGVQFSEQDATANAKIENHLGGTLNSEKQTHTMWWEGVVAGAKKKALGQGLCNDF